MKVRIIAVLLVLTALAACREKKGENLEEMARRASHPEAVLVETVELGEGIFYHELVSNGKVAARNKVVIPFRTSGTIVELGVRNGQWVRAGDTIARIEDFQYVTALTRARNRFDKAEAEHNIYWTSRNALTGDSSATGSDREKMQAISSGLTEARISLAEAEYNLNNTRIVAPISGRIANLEARLHNHSSSFREFCTIVNDELMDVVFPVIESEYRFVAPGMPVGIVPFANDTIQITGTISEINPAVSENGMIQVKASFRNDGRLIEGMNVRILIRKPEPGRLVVPREALVMRQGRDVIFIKQDSLAIWRYVEVEFENSTSLSIIDGLSAGDLIIVKGNINLSHETIVKENAR
ncbi:MAG: efflux RND transporter periplasmic adaptor subunit [Bacteroidetes bacterium]|nr:efflux RND transporter periplasmic adaptor subunit [Bacteroidota bacterium]